MLYKYIVPEHYKKMFSNKKIIYCEVINTVEDIQPKVHLVKMINFMNASNIFSEKDLQKLNILDKVKIFFIKRRNTNEKV